MVDKIVSKLKGAFRAGEDSDEEEDAFPPSAFDNAVVDKPMKKGKGGRTEEDDSTTSASSGTVRFAVPEPGDRKQKTHRHVRVAMPQAEGVAKAKTTGGKKSKPVVAPQAVRTGARGQNRKVTRSVGRCVGVVQVVYVQYKWCTR